jgi:predicted HTH transcriptional regulator
MSSAKSAVYENEQTEWKKNAAGIDYGEAITIFDKIDLKMPHAEKYPRLALQEAMINVLVHRDYELFDPARFTSYQDRIEFISPGKLPSVMTIEDLRKRRVTPIWRNQSLAWFLSRLQLAPAEGQGIQTIRSTMKAAGCPPPRFDTTEVSVTCVLRAHPRSRVVGVPVTSEARQRVQAKKGSTGAQESRQEGRRGRGCKAGIGRGI